VSVNIACNFFGSTRGREESSSACTDATVDGSRIDLIAGCVEIGTGTLGGGMNEASGVTGF
jgi:hypothetical protein